MQDLYNEISVAQSLAPAARTSNASGSGVDLRDYQSAAVVIDAGAWTDGTHAFEVQESDDDGSSDAYAAVADADLQGSEPTIDGAADDDQVYEIGYLGEKRYIRVVQTVSGGPATGLVSGTSVVRGAPRKAPA